MHFGSDGFLQQLGGGKLPLLHDLVQIIRKIHLNSWHTSMVYTQSQIVNPQPK